MMERYVMITKIITKITAILWWSLSVAFLISLLTGCASMEKEKVVDKVEVIHCSPITIPTPPSYRTNAITTNDKLKDIAYNQRVCRAFNDALIEAITKHNEKASD